MAEGADAQKGDDARPVAAHLGGEPAASGSELGGGDFFGSGGGAIHEVGDAVALAQQLCLLRRMKQFRREARLVQRRPEPVARPGEVVPGPRRVQPGVDADEEYAQTGRDDVPDSLVFRTEKLRLARPAV